MKRFWFLLVFLFVLPSPVAAKKISAGDLLPLVIPNDQIGLLFADGLTKQYGLDTNPEKIALLQKVGAKIIAVTDHPKAKYDFGILASSDFQAVSIYGGRIRVFNGLLSDTRNSEAELATVLAHEIAHNECGHNKTLVKTFKAAYALELSGITEKLPKLLLLAADAAVAKRSRKFEKQADHQALEWLKKAHYPITGAIAVFRRIEAEHGNKTKDAQGNALSSRFDMIFNTHPEPKDRVAAAEDFLLTQKYGRTFQPDEILRPTLKPITNPKTGDSPIIVAHPSLWKPSLTIISKITGIGLFNPSPRCKEEKDFDFYLNTLRQGHFVCATGDNDFHAAEGVGIRQCYTFVCSPNLSQDGLLQAIKEGQTYVSKDGTEIQSENFATGSNYPKVRTAILKFRFVFPKEVSSAPKIMVYRNGEKVGEAKTTTKGKKLAQAEYIIDDSNLKTGFYWYILYAPGKLVTSPITLEVTNNGNDPADYPASSNWYKGIIHCHSTYSDGNSTLHNIWEEGRNDSDEFVFMTDHADRFDDKNFASYVKDCHDLSGLGWPIPIMVPGVEYSLSGGKDRHLLVLVQETNINQNMSEEEFFGISAPDKLLIEQGPVHLGDDQKNSEIHKDAVFDYTPTDNATLKLRIKGSPRKDPIIWINRQEIGRVVTTDNQWHWYEFKVPSNFLKSGQNLFHIQSYIPDRWQTFDDCEVADVYILKN